MGADERRVSPRVIRRVVLVVFVAGIAGMIVGSVKDNNGVAITFGLTTAVAAVGLILIAAVVPPDALARPGATGNADAGTGTATFNDEVAADVEQRIDALVQDGADEHEVRVLVQRTIDMARDTTRTSSR